MIIMQQNQSAWKNWFKLASDKEELWQIIEISLARNRRFQPSKLRSGKLLCLPIASLPHRWANPRALLFLNTGRSQPVLVGIFWDHPTFLSSNSHVSIHSSKITWIQVFTGYLFCRENFHAIEIQAFHRTYKWKCMRACKPRIPSSFDKWLSSQKLSCTNVPNLFYLWISKMEFRNIVWKFLLKRIHVYLRKGLLANLQNLWNERRSQLLLVACILL